MTADELFALPVDDRTDRRLIHGRLVERQYPFRCPAHAAAVANLCGKLGNWEQTVAARGWSVYGYGCPYRLARGPDTVLYFDTSVVSESVVRSTDGRAAYLDGLPVLGVEVVDLSDSPEAVEELVRVTLGAGVPMLWLIDPFDELVEVHRFGRTTLVLSVGSELDATDVLPGLRCAVTDILA
jgi:Uma2 family endonuclease